MYDKKKEAIARKCLKPKNIPLVERIEREREKKTRSI